MTAFDKNQFYSRNRKLEQIGASGQEKLEKSKVVVVGAGGLGCPCLQYLASAGVGFITIVDDDKVEASNLNRQILFTPADIDQPKAEVAAQKIKLQNPFIEVIPIVQRVTKSNVLDLVKDHDIIIDCTDNFSTRYLINDASLLTGIPLVFGAIYRFEGQVSLFNAPIETGRSANYRDLYPNYPESEMIPNCSDIGVLGVLPGIIGTYQATEAIKYIVGIGELLVNKLLIVDILHNSFMTISIPNSNQSTITELGDYDESCSADEVSEIDWAELEDDILIDVRNPTEKPKITVDYAIPLAEFMSTNDFTFSRPGRIAIFCQSGLRSQAAVRHLQNLGYEEVNSIRGGIESLPTKSNQKS